MATATTIYENLPVIPQKWAGGGTAESPIPDTAAQTQGDGRASYQTGWGEINSLPLDQGGKAPNRLDFNGILQVLTMYAQAIQNGRYITFDSAVSNKIGGYPKGALLWYVVNGLPQYLVRSVVDNNTTSTLTDTSKWQPVTLSPYGMAMLGTLSDVKAAQVRNIQVVDSEPSTGVNGTIYVTLK